MNTAIISQAFIKELVLGMTLRSAAVNAQGLLAERKFFRTPETTKP
ncbi:hypothetical protein QIW46_13685 [Pseudomonas fluorescens]|jgi:hypothetical protein|nr:MULTISPECIES: hypothetical protein [Pseudomonas fluorescens group]WRH90234.1 hypothetical protein RCC30_15640 [Pseudomonas fluorescens]